MLRRKCGSMDTGAENYFKFVQFLVAIVYGIYCPVLVTLRERQIDWGRYKSGRPGLLPTLRNKCYVDTLRI